MGVNHDHEHNHPAVMHDHGDHVRPEQGHLREGTSTITPIPQWTEGSS